jgi:hypothetical protein
MPPVTENQQEKSTRSCDMLRVGSKDSVLIFILRRHKQLRSISCCHHHHGFWLRQWCGAQMTRLACFGTQVCTSFQQRDVILNNTIVLYKSMKFIHLFFRQCNGMRRGPKQALWGTIFKSRGWPSRHSEPAIRAPVHEIRAFFLLFKRKIEN